MIANSGLLKKSIIRYLFEDDLSLFNITLIEFL